MARTRKSPTTAMTAGAAVPTDELIRQRAHEIWLRNGCRDGHDVEDWLEAERELQANAPAASTTAAA